MDYSDTAYDEMLDRLFARFPSFQKVGSQAYKPGIGNMLFFDQLTGHPHSQYPAIHIAGTNGKGSVSNMLASVLSASGLRTGLYTSPHILDFRERMRIADGRLPGCPVRCISRKEVWDFVSRWRDTFDHLDLSFFEITTMMAFSWFAGQKVDVAVIETGLGGRLDSTNIITPVLSIITNIGLDHCDMLGNTLAEIAYEKAGIIKPGCPVVIGESSPETVPVFERKVLYTNLPEPDFMGGRDRIMSLLTFADSKEPALWHLGDTLLEDMDLQGCYQRRNLRTVLSALDVLCTGALPESDARFGALKRMYDDAAGGDAGTLAYALEHTASRMDFHGRWEKLSSDPPVIADIGHNAHGLRYNFRQLEQYLASGRCTDIIIVYGAVADKDLDAVFPLMPVNASYIFTNASGRRALPAGQLLERYLTFISSADAEIPHAEACGTVAEAIARAFAMAGEIRRKDRSARPMIYVGGSTYVVSEAIAPVRRLTL